MLLFLLACKPTPETSDPMAYVPPGVADRAALRGPGGPSTSFAEADLYTVCAYLAGDPLDRGFRNSVVPYRGHLLMPWAFELGFGGLSFWDVSDPCNPVHAFSGTEPAMRETHALGVVHLPEGDAHAGDWAVANAVRGITFWDMTDLNDIHTVNTMVLDDVISFDSYARTAFNLVWQYPWVFLTATDNGLIVLDATDPANAFEVARFQLSPSMRMGGIFIKGNDALVIAAGQQEAAMLDLSDPLAPQLLSRFDIHDGDGAIRGVYSGNLVGDLALFARKDQGSGPIVYDVSDPTRPLFVADAPLAEGGGGYIYWHEGFAFVGQGERADIYDMSALPTITHIAEAHLPGDLDTLTPFGNVAVLAVDDDGETDQESAVMPWRREPDRTPPVILGTQPHDGAMGVHTRARIGIAFSEFIEPTSAFPGSLVLTGPDGPVPTWSGANETFAWVTPKQPLSPNSAYTLLVRAQGVADVNNNAVAADFSFSFETGAR